jgi:hypothetical protein
MASASSPVSVTFQWDENKRPEYLFTENTTDNQIRSLFADSWYEIARATVVPTKSQITFTAASENLTKTSVSKVCLAVKNLREAQHLHGITVKMQDEERMRNPNFLTLEIAENSVNNAEDGVRRATRKLEHAKTTTGIQVDIVQEPIPVRASSAK